MAVICQADGLLSNDDAIKRHLHMSEFDSSANEVPYGDSFIKLPPKEVADMYIDGTKLSVYLYARILIRSKHISEITRFQHYFGPTSSVAQIKCIH